MKGEVAAVAVVVALIIGAGVGYSGVAGNGPTKTETVTTSRTFTTTQTETEFVSSCGTFENLPPNANTLVMNLTSTACVKITFKVQYHGGNIGSGPYYPSGGMVHPGLTIVKDTEIKSPDGSWTYPGLDLTALFNVTILPALVNLTEVPVNSTFVVLYVISPRSDARGFYDQSLPMDYCERFALAVGYLPSQVNASDFSSVNAIPPPCPLLPDIVSSVAVANMAFVSLTWTRP